jgi:hypothetical protein
MKELEAIGKSRVEKSANYGSKSQKVQKAMAIARGSETPQGAILARRILQLQRQRVAKVQYGIITKSMGLDDSQESDPLQKLESLQSEKMEIIRSMNAGNQDSTAIKRLQKIYDREGDVVRSLIGED